MMFKQIITKRKFEHKSSWDLVYEWEDEVHSFFDIGFYYEKRPNSFKKKVLKLVRRFPVFLSLIQTREKAFVFEMSDYREDCNNNRENIVPCIIDCYVNDDELARFISHFNNNKLVFVTSKQVYDYFRTKQLPFKVEHLALSLPSKYKLASDAVFSKKYDVALVGRINPVLSDYMKRYLKDNPNVTFVYHESNGNEQEYFSSTGEKIGVLDTREKYFKLLQQCKIGLYSTSGMDFDKKTYDKDVIDTCDFHQVTPRYLELIASGCHVIARYQKNSDTDYYQMESFGESVQTYGQFVEQMNKCLLKEVDLERYAKYLENHYTDVRCVTLKEIMEREVK